MDGSLCFGVAGGYGGDMGRWEVEGTAAEAHWKGRAHGGRIPWARGPVRTVQVRGQWVSRDFSGARAHGVWGPWARGGRKFRDFVAEIGIFLGKIGEILGMDGGEKMGEI